LRFRGSINPAFRRILSTDVKQGIFWFFRKIVAINKNV